MPKPARAVLEGDNPETTLTSNSKSEIEIGKGNPTRDNIFVGQKLPFDSDETTKGVFRTKNMPSVSLVSGYVPIL
jgi:hypothetical protein